MWFKPISFATKDESTIYLRVPNEIFRDWITSNYFDVLEESLQELDLEGYTVSFLIEEKQSTNGSNGNKSIEVTLKPSKITSITSQEISSFGIAKLIDIEPIELPLNPKYTFDTFVVGSCNQFAHAAALAVVDMPSKTYNPLYIYGGVGLGKTHLMHAIGHEVHRRFPKKRVAYVTSEQFMNEVIASIQTARMGEFRHKYRTVDVLLIDDVQFLAGKDRTKEEFFHTFNALHEINKQIVISSDRPPKEIPTLEDRLRSRFEWGLIADIQPPDFETRLAILKSKLGSNATLIPEEVLSFIAHKIQKNIRELEGALTRVLAFAAIHHRDIDEEEAAKLLADLIPAGARRPLTIDRIQNVVSDFYNVSLDDMKGKRRDKHIVFPRQVAMYLVRDETPSSLPAIGQAFGGRDHTTALHSIEKIANEIKEDERLRYEVESIRERLYAS